MRQCREYQVQQVLCEENYENNKDDNINDSIDDDNVMTITNDDNDDD